MKMEVSEDERRGVCERMGGKGGEGGRCPRNDLCTSDGDGGECEGMCV